MVVVAGTSEFDTQILDQARQEFGVYENRLAFTYLTKLPLQKLLTELAGLLPQTIVLFTTFFQDGARVPFVPHDVLHSFPPQRAPPRMASLISILVVEL